jgi:hypothetical protein
VTQSELSIDEAPILDFPLRGVWKLLRSPGHARYAYDLAAVDAETGRELRVSRLRTITGQVTVRDSYSWGQTVYSPVTGRVAVAHNDWPDRERLNLLRDIGAMLFARPKVDPGDIRPFTGNHVLIECDGRYVFLAHMQQGSVRVQLGDSVAAGQPIGEVGNSGYTLAPHLHLQLMDQIEDLGRAQAPPFRIREYERQQGAGWEPMRKAALVKGDLIRFGS